MFSRAVLALGADFGLEELPDELVPFKLKPTVPGTFRWATTYIARFDPEIDWPTDQEYSLEFNPNLTAFDGEVVADDNIPPPATLLTPNLTLSIASVTSE